MRQRFHRSLPIAVLAGVLLFNASPLARAQAEPIPPAPAPADTAPDPAPASPEPQLPAPGRKAEANTTEEPTPRRTAPERTAPAGSALAAGPANTPAEGAAAAEGPASGGEHRVVGGHWFITPFAVRSAMMNANFGFSQGFGQLTSGDAKLFLYSQSLTGQIGIVNRVAVELGVVGAAAVAGNLETLPVLAALANLKAGGMPKVRLLTVERIGLQLAAGAGAYYHRTLAIIPLYLLTDTPKQTLQQVESLEIVPALMLAEGLGPFGAQLSASPVISRALGQTTTLLDAGLHLAFDAGRLTPYFPIAVTAEYDITSSLKAGEQPVHAFGGGAYYNGRRDFSVGVLGSFRKQDPASFIYGSMAFQYYF